MVYIYHTTKSITPLAVKYSLVPASYVCFDFGQFCKTQPKSGLEEEARIKAEMERKKRVNAQITLMDPKTSQNVGIALAKIRLSNEKVGS